MTTPLVAPDDDGWSRWNHCIAIGDYAVSDGAAAVAIGHGAEAHGNHAVAIGHSALAVGDGAVAIGRFHDE